MIKLQIIGNLGKDCIVNEVNGRHVINFSVAHTERFKDANGNPKDRTYWVECAYWTEKLNVAKYLLKGRSVYAEGTPEADAYNNREGKPAATLRMRVREIQLLGGNQPGDTGSNAAQASTPSYQSGSSTAHSNIEEAETINDDLPF
jgi:single-strand DNA-binding protein